MKQRADELLDQAIEAMLDAEQAEDDETGRMHKARQFHLTDLASAYETAANRRCE